MEKGEKLHGFSVKKQTILPELSAVLWEMEHEKSGAKLVWLDRVEENKTFGIAFRTPPEDDTGVFHILEHSVLCGSDRYPVKEPFVELMKSSMQTFLNAMTFPDKTFYPVSSRNPKDFLNLLRVYMDAVLHPAIYHKPEIFQQEGWHYEMQADDGMPSYKGVVFNEMKGAFASPDTLLQNEIHRQLFPDNCYRHVSGGDPVHIPKLTYERFLNSHKRFYHPSNSYIFLDGQIDMNAVLPILDEDFLSAYSRQKEQPEFIMQPAVKGELARTYYEISPSEPVENRARLAWGRVLGDYTCWEELTAMQALSDVLCGSNQAPLKQIILASGLAQDVRMQVVDGILQPYMVLEVRNMDGSKVEEVERILRDELARLVREGLDHEQIAATLAHMEFQMRERDFGRMPQGLVFGMNVLESWLYGGDSVANLEVGELFAGLSRKLDEGWFEMLLERVLLRNSHSCQVLLLPSPTLGEESRIAETERLKAAKERWNEAELAALWEQQKKLDVWQSSSDKPEDIATLPSLHLSDISPKPENIPLEIDALGDIPLLHHAIPTGGVGYVNLYFDITDLNEEQFSCVSFLCTILSELDTDRHNGLELQKLQRLNLGNLRCTVEPCAKLNAPEDCRIYLCVSFSALEDKLKDAASLVAELLTGIRFDDRQRLRELLRQCGALAQQSIITAGHTAAVTRVSAGGSIEGMVKEYVDGVSCCQWLKKKEEEFEQCGETLAKELTALRDKIFTTGRLTVSVTGVENTCVTALEEILLPQLSASAHHVPLCAISPWGVRKEGITIPADVSFAALGGSLLRCGAPYSGILRVASRAISLAYLWNVIRVQGGAYGTGLALSESGNACFYSYRDPNGARSLNCYRQASGFLEQFRSVQSELSGLIIGAVAESEPLLLPSRKGKFSDSLYLKGLAYSDLCRQRAEMLATAPEGLADLAEPVKKLTAGGGVCVIGSHKQIEDCGAELATVLML